MTLAEAGKYQTLLWGGMAVGRFIGAWLMTFIEAETVLAGAALGAFGLLLVVVFGTGSVAMWALISVGLFHSIMFPTIFSLANEGLGRGDLGRGRIEKVHPQGRGLCGAVRRCRIEGQHGSESSRLGMRL